MVFEILIQVLNDCLGWLEDGNIRLFVGAVVGFAPIIAIQLIGGRRF